MDFFQNASDDQIALMGCFAALAVSVGLMYVSAFLSRSHRQTAKSDIARPTLSIGNHPDRTNTTRESSRKVA